MLIFKRKTNGQVSKNLLQFQERSYLAGIMGTFLGYLVGATWVLTHSFVGQHSVLNQFLAAGFLVAVGKPLVDKIFVSLLVPFVVNRAARRGVFLDGADLARTLPLPQVVLFVSGVSISVAIFLAKLGFSDYEILWSCSVAGLMTGMLRNWSDREENVRARQNTWDE